MYVCTRTCICMHHFSGSFPGQPMLATIDLLSPSHMMYDPVIIIFMFISMYKPSQLTLPDQQTNSNLNNSFICAFFFSAFNTVPHTRLSMLILLVSNFTWCSLSLASLNATYLTASHSSSLILVQTLS